MIFQADIAFALELIALVLGFWILIKARSNEAGNLKGFGSFIGYFVIVSAFLALLCTGYFAVKYWEEGYFNKPAQGQMMMMQGMHKMQGCDPNMMTGKMGMHGKKCSNMMDKGSHDAKCEQMMKSCMKSGMMKGEMDGDMMDKSDMDDSSNHHPDMKDNG